MRDNDREGSDDRLTLGGWPLRSRWDRLAIAEL
jgi:hypothetical protein